ncbi:MAG: hypothetical protein LBT56_01685 [Prevotellaceae bacterium]|jgi:hypothetical protein|nr:hypothetical protein [Prevotellaceae bacterium]
MKKNVWISYDLGIRGDYSGLYQWLANHDAIECGNGIAVFKVNINENEDLIEKLKSEIIENVEIRNGERLYVIYKKNDGKIAGKFLFGNRKGNPWEEYKQTPVQEDVE